jgi:hypothetical protein
MSDDERANAARAALEGVINEFPDVFVDDENEVMHMPVLTSWVLVTYHDDAADPELLCTHRLNRLHQGTHETIGLLTMALDDVRVREEA